MADHPIESVALDLGDTQWQSLSPEERQKERRTKSRVLVVMAYGKGLALTCEPGIVLDYMRESGCGASEDGFILDEESVDYCHTLQDGVYIGVLSLLDDGPGDYPGTREVCPTLSGLRPATAEEWKAHLEGEWPWDPASSPWDLAAEEGKP